MTNQAPATTHDHTGATPHGDAGTDRRAFVIRPWPRSRRKAAFALMLVMAAIIILSATIIGLRDMLSASVKENGLAELQFQALHLAECGIAIGLHPQIKPGDPALKQTIGADSGFEVNITSEGSRIPINYLTDQRFRDIVYNLFIIWKLSPQDAETAV